MSEHCVFPSQRQARCTTRLTRWMAVVSLIATMPPHKAWAACPIHREEDSQRHTSHSEIALANMVLYSQEYMKHFFADNDSDVQPIPASGMSLFLGRDFTKNMRYTIALTLPLREEEVRIKNQDSFRYYYPKVAMLGFERDIFARNVLATESCLRVSASAGLSLPFSKRFLSYLPPFVLFRTNTEIGTDVYLNFGIGYSGIISAGAWFFPFGVSYQLNNGH